MKLLHKLTNNAMFLKHLFDINHVNTSVVFIISNKFVVPVHWRTSDAHRSVVSVCCGLNKMSPGHLCSAPWVPDK